MQFHVKEFLIYWFHDFFCLDFLNFLAHCATFPFYLQEIFHTKLDFNVLIFGEWIQKGTASSTNDKFKYQDRKIEYGKLYGFGVCLTFPEGLDDFNLTKFQNALAQKGFSVAVEKEKNSTGNYLVVMLNAELKHLFDR